MPVLSAFYWTIIWMFMIVVWVAIAFWPARVAESKGHSFWGYFIFSLFFFPAALIVAYVVKDLDTEKSQSTDIEAKEQSNL
jgi:hypothetical protein